MTEIEIIHGDENSPSHECPDHPTGGCDGYEGPCWTKETVDYRGSQFHRHLFAWLRHQHGPFIYSKEVYMYTMSNWSGHSEYTVTSSWTTVMLTGRGLPIHVFPTMSDMFRELGSLDHNTYHRQ